MKRLIMILSILCVVSLAGLNYPYKTMAIAREMPVEPYLRLFNAVCIVESNNNATAFNKATKATGIAQITSIRLRDYNNRTGKSYTLHDCYNKQISKSIFLYYASQYSPYQFETISRKWNGRGYKTKIYWKRIKSELQKEK